MKSDHESEVPSLASAGDIPALTALINLAFRIESRFKKGDRIDDDGVREKMRSGSIYKLVSRDSLVACVYVEGPNAQGATALTTGADAGYIGLLAVDPSQQGRGVGKRMMEFAEGELKRRGCARAQLRIIHLRAELLSFYRSLGYRETGTSPYPAPERLSVPVHFVQMEKDLE